MEYQQIVPLQLTGGATVLIGEAEDLIEALVEALRFHAILIEKLKAGEKIPGSSQEMGVPGIPYTKYRFLEEKTQEAIRLAARVAKPVMVQWKGIEFAAILVKEAIKISHCMPL
jgi:hypothetical protein